jgi:hypothetical protein
MLAEQGEDDNFKKFVDELLKTGLVDLSEKGKTRVHKASENGGSGGTGDEEQDATDRWNEAIKKFMEENEDATIGDATEAVARDNEQLYDEYRRESYSFEERE